ncbi:hypothetical protein LINGRAHAP2_LOCUS7782 [Linum grandiflorum]
MRAWLQVLAKWLLIQTPSKNSILALGQITGPPSVPPQMFDMLPRPQGIVIREPNQEDEYLEQHSPDSVLFKDPSTVLQELTGTSLSQDELMEEQCAIEAEGEPWGWDGYPEQFG